MKVKNPVIKKEIEFTEKEEIHEMIVPKLLDYMLYEIAKDDFYLLQESLGSRQISVYLQQRAGSKSRTGAFGDCKSKSRQLPV